MTPEELITYHLAGELDSAGQEELHRWREASPDNEAEYRSLVRTWRQLSARRTAIPEYPGLPEVAGPPPVPRVHRRATLARSAVGLAVAASLAGLLLHSWRGAQVSSTLQPQVTVAGEHPTTVRLEDGSLVRLAPGSTLEALPETGGREVRLVGRAFWAVAPDPEHPFRIHTAAGDVSVLGTRFDVVAGESEVAVVVVDGRVRVESVGGESVVLPAGQRGGVHDGVLVQPEPVGDVFESMKWMDQAMVFQSTALERVADELRSRFGVTIEIRQPELAQQTVTAAFSDQSLEEVVKVVCGVVNAICEVGPEGHHVVIGEMP
jgi:transmembrane sensor